MIRRRGSQDSWTTSPAVFHPDDDPDDPFDADAWFWGLTILWDRGLPTSQHLEAAPPHHRESLLDTTYEALGFDDESTMVH